MPANKIITTDENGKLKADFDISALSGSLTYIHQQLIAEAQWIINHNLNSLPSLVIVNVAGEQIFGDVVYEDVNNVVVNFSIAVAGKAYLK